MHHTDWIERRRFDSGEFSRADLARRQSSVSVCVPTLDEAGSIARTLAPLAELLGARLIDQVAVVDSGSSDSTRAIVERAGIEFYDARELLPEAGRLLGKGDALWRALSVLDGDVVCFVDADSEDFGEHFVTGLCGPLLTHRALRFVKGAYTRPLKLGEARLAEGGGRVTEVAARPLLNAFYPELAVFRQPLAGEIAARRELLLEIPFDTGYALEMGMLIDVWCEVGLERMAEVDLGTRQNRHRPLAELTPMAATVLQAVIARLRRQGRLIGDTSTLLLDPSNGAPSRRDAAVVQRPPHLTAAIGRRLEATPP